MSKNFDYDVSTVNTQVSAELDEDTTPKPWYRTSAFYTLLTTYVVGGVVAFLVANGVVDAGQAGNLTDIVAGAIVVGIGYVSGKFIEGRTAVSVVKAKAAAVRSMAASSPQALAAFKSLD